MKIRQIAFLAVAAMVVLTVPAATAQSPIDLEEQGVSTSAHSCTYNGSNGWHCVGVVGGCVVVWFDRDDSDDDPFDEGATIRHITCP